MPIGVYLARAPGRDRQSLSPGTFVAVCLPSRLAAWGRARGYLHRGSCADGIAPIGKPIAAVAGDTMTVAPRGLARNGKPISHSAALSHDRSGRVLPHVAWGTYTTAPGDVWLVSTRVAASWDSRYYGPIPVECVVAILRPLWVWRG